MDSSGAGIPFGAAVGLVEDLFKWLACCGVLVAVLLITVAGLSIALLVK